MAEHSNRTAIATNESSGVRSRVALAIAAACAAFAASRADAPRAASPGAAPAAAPIATVPGMPPVVDPSNLYSETVAGRLSAAVQGDLERIYVPNLRGNDVTVIDPATSKVVDRFPVGRSPQHVVPSWDLRTLWVANNAERHADGSLTPVDPRTGKPGRPIPVDDPYNLYFTPDGKSAIVVAEAKRRLDFRDPHTLALQYSIDTPRCGGINHADFSIDGRYAIFTCEFDGAVAKIDLEKHQVLGYLKLALPPTRLKEVEVAPGAPTTEICTASKGMPQDIRISPDGKRFYVADMDADGVHVLDGDAFKEVGFVTTGVGAHGLYPSRDGTKLYVANRGSHKVHGQPHGRGGVTVLDFRSGEIVAQWSIPGGGSPDMGNVTADGRALWLSGRFDNVVYRFDTSNGSVTQVAVGLEPHGLAVWPQPGRYSLGHTGNLR
ncbi:MAG TPA: YncE family protein [Burkholderiaceae bacterium]|nr:YncE family protein [Burkholderiaceae bacterium]